MPKDPIKEAIEFGIDISLLQENLKRTPTERLQRHFDFLAFALELRRAYQKQHDPIRKTHKKAA